MEYWLSGQDYLAAIEELQALIRALAKRVAAQSELLSRRADRPPVSLTETDSCPLG